MTGPRKSSSNSCVDSQETLKQEVDVMVVRGGQIIPSMWARSTCGGYDDPNSALSFAVVFNRNV